MRGGFTTMFGRSSVWWVAAIVGLCAPVVLELAVTAVRRVYFPTDQDLAQEAELHGDVDDIDPSQAGVEREGRDAKAGEAKGENGVVGTSEPYGRRRANGRDVDEEIGMAR